MPMSQDDMTVRLYKTMLLIRQLELHLAQIYPTDAIKSPVHLSVGQESIAAGVCDPLLADDMVSNTYRCHATYIAKGGDLKEMMAELYGKATGCAGGKAGSMHLINMQHGVMGASAVVGTTVPIAAGYAFALQQEAKQTGHQRVVVSLFGDGCTEEGCFYESLNFAALKKLPIIFVCENNGLAIHTPVHKRWATQHLCQRVATYGIRTHQITNADVFAIRETVNTALNDIRSGQSGPVFIECATYRWLEHVGPRDDHADGYRDSDTFNFWKQTDQIKRLAAMLDQATREQIQREVSAIIQEAADYAEKSPYPGPEELLSHVYAD